MNSYTPTYILPNNKASIIEVLNEKRRLIYNIPVYNYTTKVGYTDTPTY